MWLKGVKGGFFLDCRAEVLGECVRACVLEVASMRGWRIGNWEWDGMGWVVIGWDGMEWVGIGWMEGEEEGGRGGGRDGWMDGQGRDGGRRVGCFVWPGGGVSGGVVGCLDLDDLGFSPIIKMLFL